MIVSLDWLSDYVDLPEVDALEERLLLSGLNHESTKTVDSDTAVDLEVTSNRPDCLGHIGIAREVSVLFGRPRFEKFPFLFGRETLISIKNHWFREVRPLVSRPHRFCREDNQCSAIHFVVRVE